MTKESIIERLLDQGHIVIVCADRILNKKGQYLQDVEDLHRDGPISTSEAVVLLSEDTAPVFPNITQPHISYPWTPSTPPDVWCSTTTEL